MERMCPIYSKFNPQCFKDLTFILNSELRNFIREANHKKCVCELKLLRWILSYLQT